MSTRTTQSADYSFIAYLGAILVFGLILLSSAGVAVGLDSFNDPYFFVKRQIMLGLIPGIIIFIITAKINYTIWYKFAIPIFIFGLLLLIAVFIPGLGSTNNTFSRSWLTVLGHSFQPAEAMKLALVVFLAWFLSHYHDRVQSLTNGFLLALGLGCVPIFLIALQPDIGTAFILCCIVIIMLFVAGAKWLHLGALVVTAATIFALLIFTSQYRADRLMTFLHPELDPQGVGYHINQAFLAIGSGGFFGLGLGHSRQKFQYLPEVHADSIFAVTAEEMGFLFATALVVLLILIACRGFMVAKNAPDQFAKLLVSGIIVWFTVQSFLNIGAMVGLLPLTGVPLPFVSHGGTALLVGMAAVGILINVSKHN